MRRDSDCITEAMCRQGKKWGAAHGFWGAPGGWIRDRHGRAVCHGWGNFYRRYRSSIEQFADVK